MGKDKLWRARLQKWRCPTSQVVGFRAVGFQVVQFPRLASAGDQFPAVHPNGSVINDARDGPHNAQL